MHIGHAEFPKPAAFDGNAVYMMMKLLFSESKKLNGETYYLAVSQTAKWMHGNVMIKHEPRELKK